MSDAWSASGIIVPADNLFVQDPVDTTKQILFDVSGATTGTSTTIQFSQTADTILTFPSGTDTVITETSTDTLLNKTLTDASNDIIANGIRTASTIVNTSAFPAPITGQVLTATSGTGANWQTPITETSTNTLSNKSFIDNTTFFQNVSDSTKQIRFSLSGISTSNTRVLTVPDVNINLIGGPGTSVLDQEIVRFNGTSGNLIQGAGVRHYGASVTDPVSPAPQAGDEYYNTAINHKMVYDGTRSKWLSIATLWDGAGRNGGTGANGFYRRFNGMVLGANTGAEIQKGTIVYIGYTTNNSVSHTFEVLVNGVVIASLASGGANSASDSTVNADFDAGNISFRNASGSSSTNNLQATVYYKLRP